jgi:AraC-like DNA-binding protein
MAVRALASKFGMSRAYFSHVFRQRTGLSPAHFLAEVRTDEAARLLRDTDQPVKAIAAACGFVDVSHFTKTFRRLQHQTPASFRRANQASHRTS